MVNGLSKVTATLGMILLLSACSGAESDKTSINQKDVEPADVSHSQQKVESTLRNELTIGTITLKDSLDKVKTILGDPLKEQDMPNSGLSDVIEVIYDTNFFLLKENNVIGFTTEDEQVGTASGIRIHDSVNKLLEVYNDRNIQYNRDTFYIYDDECFLVFGATELTIESIGIFETESTLSVNNITFDELLLDSEPFNSPIIKGEEGGSETIEENTADLTNQFEEVGVVEEVTPADEEVYNPFAEQEELARFSKTVQIGNDESIIKEYISVGDPSWEDERYTIYSGGCVGFYTREGKVKLISWGRSGTFEEWETNEGIGRDSTLDQTIEAYRSFQYKLLYKQGMESPSYMEVDYHGSQLVFEFNQGTVGLIFLCSPEMLDELMVKNGVYTNDRLEEQPF